MEDLRIPHFVCKVIQGENEISIPIPCGNLENIVIAMLNNNPGTFVKIEKYESYGNLK